MMVNKFNDVFSVHNCLLALMSDLNIHTFRSSINLSRAFIKRHLAMKALEMVLRDYFI